MLVCGSLTQEGLESLAVSTHRFWLKMDISNQFVWLLVNLGDCGSRNAQ